jgi:hypothetical protein
VGYAIGNAIWDDHDYFDWGHGDIKVDIDRKVNIDIDRNNINIGKWEHNSYHRRGVKYDNDAIRNKFAKAETRPADRKLDFRGRDGEQVLKPGKGDARPGDRPNLGGDGRPDLGGPGNKPGAKPSGKPDLGGLGDRPSAKPGAKPDIGQIQQGLKDRPGAQAALERKKPNLGGAKPKDRTGGGAFDPSDGARAKDFSKRGQASLGNRGAGDFARPKGGGGHAIKGGGAKIGKVGGGGHRGGGRGGGGRRR